MNAPLKREPPDVHHEADTVQPSSARCGLLKLPPELRNRIYEYALTVQRDTVRLEFDPQRGEQGVLSLLQTCRQIHQEARSAFYYSNHLHIAHWRLHDEGGAIKSYHNLQCFVDATSKPRLQAIRHLTLDVRGAEEITLDFRLLQPCTNLQSLQLRFERYCNPKYLAKDLRRERRFMMKQAKRLTSIEEIRIVIDEDVEKGKRNGLVAGFDKSMGEVLQGAEEYLRSALRLPPTRV